MKEFVIGDTVVWNPNNLNQDWWSALPENDKVKHYHWAGYSHSPPKYFTFICHHRPQLGHCVLISMDDQEVHTMVHTSEFDLVDEDDC